MRKRHYLKAAFVGGKLITGEHGQAIEDSIVVMKDGKFVYAGARDSEDVPDLDVKRMEMIIKEGERVIRS